MPIARSHQADAHTRRAGRGLRGGEGAPSPLQEEMVAHRLRIAG
jgi:hypothetical protein